MTITITAYGGVAEIGGNKILLEDGELRLFFDFGKSFGRYSDFFDGVFIKDRVGRGLLDPLSLGLIPPLRGLLRDDLVPAFHHEHLEVHQVPPAGRRRKPIQVVDLRPAAVEAFWEHWAQRYPSTYRDLRREGGPAVDLVLLSHAHQDHISDLEYVSPEVPACSTRMTAFISKVLLDAGMATSGAPYVAPRAPQADGLLAAARREPFAARPWWFLEDKPEGQPGDDPLENAASFWAYGASKGLEPRALAGLAGLNLKTWPVDHSLFGAVAAAVETNAGWVAYTGDLRFHGALGAATWSFAEQLGALKPTALLCEGTRLSQPNRTTEQQVFEKCLSAVRAASGALVVADFAPRNVERLQSFQRIAEANQRRLLLQPKDAYLLRAMHLAEPTTPDLMQNAYVGLYDDPKLSQYPWERSVRQRYADRTFTPLDIRPRPGEFILAFSLTDMADMVDLHYLMGDSGTGAFVFSNSKAYDDEQKVDLVRLWNWTERLGLDMIGLEPARRDRAGKVVEVQPTPGYHASGHAGVDELVRLVRTVKPRVLIPIHTEEPERWFELLEGAEIEVRPPAVGEPIHL